MAKLKTKETALADVNTDTTVVEANETTEETKGSKGVVLYTDGGSYKSNPGPIGSGIHGYTYTFKPGKGKVALPEKTLATTFGYLDKADSKKVKEIESATDFSNVIEGKVNYEVIPDNFINLKVSGGEGTNNQAELIGMLNAIDFINQYNSKNEDKINHAMIISDSTYVLNGIEKSLPSWRNNNWIKPDGTEVPNKKHWSELGDSYDKLKEDVKVHFGWIKGHNGNPGNETADKLASIAAVESSQRKLFKEGEEKVDIAATIRDLTRRADIDFWKKAGESHPLLFAKRLFFNPLRHEEETKLALNKNDTSKTYYLLEPGYQIEDDLIGKEISDASIMIAHLTQPDKWIETMIGIQKTTLDVAHRNSDVICQGFLDVLFNKEVKRDISNFHYEAMHGNADNVGNIFLYNGKAITRVMNPQYLAGRLTDKYSRMLNVMDLLRGIDTSWKAKLKTKDITDMLYETDKKGNSVLQKDITNNVKAMSVNMQIDEHQSRDIKLTFGIDIMPRNSLKHIECYKPKVSLVLLDEGNGSYIYYTFIHLTETNEFFMMQSTHSCRLFALVNG